MSVEEFQAYWRERHPAVVVRLPGVRRYVQSHTRPAGYRKGEPIYDGIAEVWFDDSRVMHALRGTDWSWPRSRPTSPASWTPRRSA